MIEYNRIFFDTAPLIYYLEENSVFFDIMKQFFEKQKYSDYVSSVVTVGEYLTGAFRNGRIDNESKFKSFIQVYDIEIADIDWNIAEEAARIREKHRNFKMMDSMQLSTAKEYECDVFITNDKQLKQFDDIEVLLVDDMIPLIS